MIVTYDTAFYSDLEKITDISVVHRAENAIEKLKAANSLRQISNIKSMQGSPGYYRIRFGDFRIGFRMVDETTVVLLAIDHRSVFYRNYP